MMQNLEFRPLVMFHPSHPLARLLKWPLVAVTMMGFLGLLALQSFSLPDEMPRAAMERLLGVDIAPAPAGHSMMMHHGMSMVTMPQHTHHHHHHDGTETCPLCPLLSLPAALPLGLVLLPPLVQRWIRRGSHASLPRAPPIVVLGLPPSHGPPA